MTPGRARARTRRCQCGRACLDVPARAGLARADGRGVLAQMRLMAGYRELLEKEVIEAWRTHRVVMVCALYIVLGIASPLIIRYLPELQALFGSVNEELGLGELGLADAIDLLTRDLVQFGSIAAVLLAMGSVAGERDRGTLGLVVSKPVSRTAVL